MIVHEHHSNQQVHEEERANEDEEHCEHKVEDLAIVFDWTLNNLSLTESDESMNVYT